jgi:aminoglycoside 6-adenylyltransferase
MYEETDKAQAVTDWARHDENVRAVVLTSSRANPNVEVDALSDYDIDLYVRDTRPFENRDEWMSRFGDIMVRHPEWDMVIYKDGSRIDFSIGLVEELENEAGADEGYVVLLDKDGATEGLKAPTYSDHWTKTPTEAEYLHRIHRFWFNVTYVAKGLYRDQLFYAKQALDGHLHHSYLKEALSWYLGMKSGWTSNPGNLGRWLKKQLDPELWRDVEATFAGVAPEDNWNAMFRLADLYGKLMSEVGAHLGYPYPVEVDREVTKYLKHIRRMDADRH